MKRPRFEDPRNHWNATIVCLINLIFVTLCINGLWAKEADKKEKAAQLEAVVVSATRMDAPRHEVADNITVISAEDIQKLPVSNAAEVLQYVPGVYMEFNGGLGSQATAMIQGSEFRHVAVYQDGIPLNQLSNSMMDLSYLTTDAIDRIEVVKGAASSAWGSSLGGVINIITKEPDFSKPFSTEVRASHGGNDTFKGRGTVSMTEDRLGVLVSVTEDESDGFIDHHQYRQEAIYTKVQYYLGDTSRLDFVYSFEEGLSGDPVIDDSRFWDEVYRKRTYQRLLFEASPSDDLEFTIEGRHHHFVTNIDDVHIDRREKYFDYSEQSWGMSGRLAYHTHEHNRLNLGFDGDWGKYDFSLYPKKYSSGNWAIYANDSLSLEKFSFNIGVRYDHNQDFGSELSPSFGVVYRFSGQDVIVRAKVARGFSAPPSAWVNDPVVEYKNPKPEIGINYQLGCDMQLAQHLKIELNSFWTDVKELIQFDWGPPPTFSNIAKATRRGIEARIYTTFDFGLALSMGGSFIDVRDDDGDDIKDIPTTLYDVSANYTFQGVSQTLVGKYVCMNSAHPETRDRVFIFDYLFKAQLPLPDRYGKISLFGAVYNLFNSTHLFRFFLPQPDRWMEAGVKIEF